MEIYKIIDTVKEILVSQVEEAASLVKVFIAAGVDATVEKGVISYVAKNC